MMKSAMNPRASHEIPRTMEEYRNAPRAHADTSPGAALLARRHGRPPPKSARGPPPARMHDVPRQQPVDSEQLRDLEHKRMYDRLVLPQYATWSPEKVVSELERKMSQHVDPTRVIIRSLGVGGQNAQNRLSVKTFGVVCVKMGIVITEEQAKLALEAKGLPTDGSLTISAVLAAFMPQRFEDGSILTSREEPARSKRGTRPSQVLALSGLSAQELAHELIRKLHASASTDSKLLMTISSSLRPSAADASVAAPTSMARIVDPSLLVVLFRRYGIACTDAQAREIWALYGMPASGCSFAAFCDAFLDSNRNHVMHRRHKQPPPESPRYTFAEQPPDEQQLLEQQARDMQAQTAAYAAAAALRPPRMPRPHSARTPRGAAADARRAQLAAENRARRDALLARTPPSLAAPPPVQHGAPPAVPSLRAAAQAHTGAAGALKSPRRLATGGSATSLRVELNPKLDASKRNGLLQAYAAAMRDGLYVKQSEQGAAWAGEQTAIA